MRMALFWSVLFVPACGPTLLEPSITEEATCDIYVQATDPAPDSVDAYWRDPIVFELSGHDISAEAHANVPGWTEIDGTTVTFWPDEPLEPNTHYDVSLEYCGGQPTISFETSDLGSPLDEPPVGRTWVVDAASGRYLAGEHLALAVTGLFTDRFLVTAFEATDGELSFRVAEGEAGGERQELCLISIDLTAAQFTDGPYFEFKAGDVVFPAYGVDIELADLYVAGTLASDGSLLGGLTFAASVDTRPLATMIEVEEDELCLLASAIGAACEPCDDGGKFCLNVALDRIQAWEIATPVVPITEAVLSPECIETE